MKYVTKFYLGVALVAKPPKEGKNDMINMKYITVQLFEHGGRDIKSEVVAVLFPIVEDLSHKDVASLHKAGRRAVISAGFCEINLEKKSVLIYGESETLRMGPKEDDGAIIAKYFGWEKIKSNHIFTCSDKCVHTEHCCAEHGCKYGDNDCPVWLGFAKQSCGYWDGGDTVYPIPEIPTEVFMNRRANNRS